MEEKRYTLSTEDGIIGKYLTYDALTTLIMESLKNSGEEIILKIEVEKEISLDNNLNIISHPYSIEEDLQTLELLLQQAEEKRKRNFKEFLTYLDTLGASHKKRRGRIGDD